jgi:hypothetical protein
MSAQPKNLPAIPEGATTLLQVIERAARDPAVDIDKMERLMQMHERILARDAEAAFNDALSACQKEMRAIATDAENPQTKSRYATYAALDRVLRPIYTAHDFSISWNTAPSDKPEHVRVLGYLSLGGHTRTYQVDMPSDGKGAKGGDVMTKTHATGAGMSYGQRYLLKGMFNVRIGEEDNDGNTSGMPESEVADWIEKIEKTTTKGKAKEVWHEAVKIAKEHNDAWASKKLKDALIKHGEFIDSAALAK